MTAVPTGPATEREDVVPGALRAHWASWLGAEMSDLADIGTPLEGARPRLVVVGSHRRTGAGWDGRVHTVAGVVAPDGTAVLSVPPHHAADVRELVGRGIGLDELRRRLPDILRLPDHAVYRATYRWTTEPAGADVLPDAGRWLPAGDERVPEWLRPFGGEVLVALDDGGRYLAGVGLKQHDEYGQEIAVGTAEAARGRGLARRLVAQAARRLTAAGAVPTYLHDPDNVASARVASAAGLPDRGWTALGIAGPEEEE